MGKLDSRTKRKALEPGKYHQDALGEGLYLRYRRPEGMETGTWTARRMDESKGKLIQARIGDADDILTSDGNRVLTYVEARKATEAWAATPPEEAKSEDTVAGVTVKDVINAYVEDARSTRKDPRTAEDSLQAAEANIIPALGHIKVADLTVEGLKGWLTSFISHGGLKTGRKRKVGEPVEYRVLPDPVKDQEAYFAAVKRRKSSANRTLAILKGALNLAVENKLIPKGELPWADVPPFKGAAGQRMRFLDVHEVQALVKACDPELRLLVSAALFTGARYGELTKAKVKDFDPSNGSLRVDGKGKDSRVRHIFLSDEGLEFFKFLVAGRGKGEPLFTHHDVERQTGASAVAAIGEAQIPLSSAEAAVLEVLQGMAGNRITYRQIEDTLWPGEKVGRRAINTLDQLRRKLQDEGVTLRRGDEGVCLVLPEGAHLVIRIMAAKAQGGKGRWQKHDVRAPLAKAVERAKIEPVVFHELRHTYASDLIKRGVQLMIVADQLGHVDTRMVEKHYGHLAQATKRDAIRIGATVLGIIGQAHREDDESDEPGPKAARMIQARKGRGTKT